MIMLCSPSVIPANVPSSRNRTKSSTEVEEVTTPRMVVVLIRWRIRKDRVREFEAHWKRLTVQADTGLYREILTRLDEEAAPKFCTFDIGDPSHVTYVNVGIWESLEKFDNAISKYMPPEIFLDCDDSSEVGEAFEHRIRQRVVMNVVTDRGGVLPTADLYE